MWQIQFNILPQISHTFYRIKRNNEVLFLLILLFEILNIAFYGVMGSMVNKSTMFSKQSLIRLYKLENKGFVQYGQAFFLCFATYLPHLLCKGIKDRYNLILCFFSDMQINLCYSTPPCVSNTILNSLQRYSLFS